MSSLSFSLLKPPPLPLSTPFIHGGHHHHHLTTKFSTLSLTTPPPPSSTPSSFSFVIKAMRSMQGRVVCSTSDKTVAVEVTRLAQHPKYKRRVRIKKKYQAHDPNNQFQVGDVVQLEKCRPISKTKAFLAVVPAARTNSTKVEAGDIGVPLQSQQTEGDNQ